MVFAIKGERHGSYSVGIWERIPKNPLDGRLGASCAFLGKLNRPAIYVPMVNSDNNQHAANENLRLDNYVEGIKTWIAILTQPNVK